MHVPQVEAVDGKQGYILISDLGDRQYLTALNGSGDPGRLYDEVMDELLLLQVAGRRPRQLPTIDAAMLEREMGLMPEWFIERHLKLQTSYEERRMIESTFALAQRPGARSNRRCSCIATITRAISWRATRIDPGIIDFQDALAGPVGYDLVSLLKDCYIAWPRQRVVHWVFEYRARLIGAGAPQLAGSSDSEFLRWFDSIGLQRHIKMLGDLRAALVSRRQDGLPRRSAADAALRA